LPRSGDPVEDRARARRLVASAKNLHEHALVVEAVADTLAPYCQLLHVPRRPSLVQTDSMWHLGTEITGALRVPEASSLELAMALHPTPAVCGAPRAEATAMIAELEGFDRGYFGGCVGHCDERGDGEWAVTIRCAEARGDALRLFAGAGIIAASVPDDELAETAAKLRTMSRALGFEQLIEAT
jgi:isochorismate synthase